MADLHDHRRVKHEEERQKKNEKCYIISCDIAVGGDYDAPTFTDEEVLTISLFGITQQHPQIKAIDT